MDKAQEMLFRQIRQQLPDQASLADAVADVLHLSPDSVYRRIRGETPLVLDEAKALCDHFHLSLDQLFSLDSKTVLFRNIRIDHGKYSFEEYFSGLLELLRKINQVDEKEIIYLTKDIPLIHNFYFPELTSFRYYFWMKCILQHPDFANLGYQPGNAGPGIHTLCRELAKEYSRIPSVEIWNAECVNSAISQVEFCKGAGYFSSAADIRDVYNCMEETIQHIRSQTETGLKCMPGENPLPDAGSYRFFFNRIILGDNTILVRAGSVTTAYLNYNALNYMSTRDEGFCRECGDDLRQLMRKSTLISQTGEKQRNIFFGILLSKIEDRLKNL